MPEPHAENLQFTLHNNVLTFLVHAQAGSLQKALLEAVMNSVDAGASRCSVQLAERSFRVVDDGRGFASRDEVVALFGQFGTPHVEGDATYGRFRIGRGQLMAFAATRWRSGHFEMAVDVKTRGYSYDLREHTKAEKGLTIDGMLYTALSAEELARTCDEFSRLVEYAPIPVVLNGRRVSRQLKRIKWDFEDDDAYYKLGREEELLVYNQGILVRGYGSWEYGCGGVVVSKRPLLVNFARNDVLVHSCAVFKRIVERVKEVNFAKLLSGTQAMGDGERRFAARNVLLRRLDARWRTLVERLKVVRAAGGIELPIAQLLRASRLCVAPDDNSRIGEKLTREGRALVLSPKTLSRFGVYDVESLVARLEQALDVNLSGLQVVDFEDLAVNESDTLQPLADEALAAAERAALQAVRAVYPRLVKWLRTREPEVTERQLSAGDGTAAWAWTDGKERIWLARRLLTRLARHPNSFALEVLMTLVHEHCHDEADYESHEHGTSFYRKHHDWVQYNSAGLMQCALHLARAMRKATRDVDDNGLSGPVLSTPVP